MNKITKNSVYAGISLDGYIADKNDGLDWLDIIPNPDGDAMGYYEFMSRIDALVMGRRTFEIVCGFDVDWPYEKPVFVLSSTLNKIPEEYNGKAFLLNGSVQDILAEIHKQGYHRLYIDGGLTIQNFFKEDLIDELILTTLPIILGGGIALFGPLTDSITFELVSSKVHLDQIVQNQYVRKSP